MRSRTGLCIGLTVLLIASLSTPSAAALQATDEFRWTGTLSRGQIVEIKNANGPLYAEASASDEVEIVALKEGDDREEVEIEVVEHEDGITVCAVYPDGWFRSNSCEPGDEGHVGSDRTDAEVTFRVKIPEGVAYHGRTMNGAVEVEGLRSDVDLLTMNGAVRVATSGWARAKTMNGAVTVEMGQTDWSGDIEISTMNGRIEVLLPDDADVDLEAKTMNGSIDSDFPLEHSGWIRNKAEGRIGDGGRGLELSTMNGRITIRRAS